MVTEVDDQQIVFEDLKNKIVIFFMKSIIIFILAFLIFNLTFVKEGHAALSNNDQATPLFVQLFSVSDEEAKPRGITFNNDGSKMYIVGEDGDDVNEYNLSTNFDVSTASFVDSYSFMTPTQESNLENRPMSVKFNNDGTKMFIIGRGSKDMNEFILSTAYDVSTAKHETQLPFDSTENAPNGFDFNNDGTMLYITGSQHDSMFQFSLNVAFDLSEGVNLLRTVDLEGLHDTNIPSEGEDEPFNIEFNLDGTRMFVVGTKGNDINQYTLSIGFNISTASFDGGLNLNTEAANPSGVAFSNSGLKMYIVGDTSDEVNEYHLKCPFNLFVGKCPSITKNSDRTGIAEAQIELAKRTINFSTNSALNRLKWIRRNKDKQNLSNQNVKLNFSNSMLSSLEALPISSFKKISTSKNNNDSNKNYFYWSEGSVSLGRVGDTSIASTKEVHTNSLTFGYDRFTDDYGISGLAFRYGNDDVDVGSAGSNLSSNTYNITYYSTSPIKDDTKYVDKIFGIGKIRSDILTVLDGKNLTADRTGNQIYGTVKIKDEYKKDNLILIPSGQFDFGQTILHGYKETGTGAIEVEDQHVRTKKLRATIAIVEDLSNDKYEFKRHGKLEYVADIDRSSNFKYRYVSDSSSSFDDTLHTGALHNLNGEIGFDIIFPEHYSIFVIYERNHAFGSGYTDNIHIALGYLPYKDTEFAFSVDGSDNLMSQFEIKKNINGYDFSFNLKNDLTNLGNDQEASINLNKVF